LNTAGPSTPNKAIPSALPSIIAPSKSANGAASNAVASRLSDLG
jgi:hypothetical protein